jgi:hypothetical protein
MDKVFQGLIAGIIAAIFMNLINLIFFYKLNLIQIRFLDWSGIIMLGNQPKTLVSIIYSLIIHILWTGTLGIIFNYLINQISQQGFIIKGGLYAFLITFIFRTLVVLFEIPLLANSNSITSLVNTATSFSWGTMLALILQKFKHSY